MNLADMLQQRSAAGRPVRVGLIGAGKFAGKYLAQARHTPGVHIMAIADLSRDRAREACRRAGWPKERFSAGSFEDARTSGATFITDSAEGLIAAGGLEIVIEATGSPKPASGTASSPSRRAAISSWLTWRPTWSPARFSPQGLVRPD